MNFEEFDSEIEYLYVLTVNGDVKYEVSYAERNVIINPYPPCRKWDKTFELSKEEAYRIVKKEKNIDIRWKSWN